MAEASNVLTIGDLAKKILGADKMVLKETSNELHNGRCKGFTDSTGERCEYDGELEGYCRRHHPGMKLRRTARQLNKLSKKVYVLEAKRDQLAEQVENEKLKGHHSN